MRGSSLPVFDLIAAAAPSTPSLGPGSSPGAAGVGPAALSARIHDPRPRQPAPDMPLKRKQPGESEEEGGEQNEGLRGNAPAAAGAASDGGVVLLGGISCTAAGYRAVRKPFKVRCMPAASSPEGCVAALPVLQKCPTELPSYLRTRLTQPPLASRPDASGRGLQVGSRQALGALLFARWPGRVAAPQLPAACSVLRPEKHLETPHLDPTNRRSASTTAGWRSWARAARCSRR